MAVCLGAWPSGVELARPSLSQVMVPVQRDVRKMRVNRRPNPFFSYNIPRRRVCDLTAKGANQGVNKDAGLLRTRARPPSPPSADLKTSDFSDLEMGYAAVVSEMPWPLTASSPRELKTEDMLKRPVKVKPSPRFVRSCHFTRAEEVRDGFASYHLLDVCVKVLYYTDRLNSISDPMLVLAIDQTTARS
jgi:hypothetical protein